MKIDASAGTRGRPRDLAKREQILAAARRLFLNYGPDLTSMEQIAEKAGVAKATLYANFEDKTALLTEIITRESERLVAADFALASRAAGVTETLTKFGEQLLAFLSDPEMLALERLAASSRSYNPSAALSFFEAGVGRAMNILRGIIARGHTDGFLNAPDVAQASEDLVGLWEGVLRVEMNFLIRTRLSPDEINRRAAHGVTQFMRLYRVKVDE